MNESQAGWSSLDSSDVGLPDDEHDTSIATAEHDRYEIHDKIGQGGMGTVSVALDRRLGREVALKQVSVDASSSKAQQRLAHEAEITAWLEHPNIVPVYDAGVERDGAHFYTMRLVRGRSFREAIEESRAQVDERGSRAMLRHYLAACQAVAFAHSRGVVHRDLTPSNIMVGAFGETQVVDWGLAARTRDDALPVVGTPGYMSPDKTATTQGDVWSLGAILKDVLAPRSTPLPEIKDLVPGELFAVLRSCLSTDPAQRFPDAGALAEEMQHYLDGRRIASHEYSVTELLGRAWKAWRVQIVAACIAAVVVVVVSAVAWQRLRTQRDRATHAEQETQVALQERSTALQESLQQQAIALLAEGNVRASESVALRAMEIAETPEMRGALIDAHSRPRPILHTQRPLPECEKVEPVGDDAVVCWGGATLVAYDVGTGSRKWSVDSVAIEVRRLPAAIAVLDTSYVLTIRSIATGEPLSSVDRQSRFARIQRDHAGTWVATSGGRFVEFLSTAAPHPPKKARLCGDELVAAVGLGHEWTAVACRSGRLLRARLGVWEFEDVGTIPIASPSVPLHSLAVSEDDRFVAASNSNGEAVLVGLDGTPASRPVKVAKGLAELQFVDDTVLVDPTSGSASLWNLGGRTSLMEFPGSVVSFLRRQGSIVSIVGTNYRQWLLPRPLVAHTFRAGAGLAAAATRNTRVAAAGADGAVSIWTRDGAPLRTLRVGDGVVKRAVFSDDGEKLAVAHGGEEGLLVFETRTWSRLPAPTFPGGVRGLDWREDELVVAPYRDRVHFVRGPDAIPSGPTDVLDLNVGHRGDSAALANGGTVWWCDASAQTFDPVVERPGATLVHALADGQRVATVVGTTIELHRIATGDSEAFQVQLAGVTDVESSEDGQFLFVSAVDGTLEVWTTADPRRIARWQAHETRISHLRARDGVLMSAGWDGTAKRWTLAPLDFDLRQFERRSEAAWGPGDAPGRSGTHIPADM